MGGSGSGRYAEKFDYTVEDCLIINMNTLVNRTVSVSPRSIVLAIGGVLWQPRF